MIDFVLPWVDGNDPIWQKEKEKCNPVKNSDSNSSARFRDMGTLKYVLRAIEKNCPWYNKIYLITAGHYPEWLDINHEKIVLVTHEELYFNKTHLPVFSSSSIEMNLANIKGLSDKFVYLNDDMVILGKLEESRFFVDNKPIDFLSHGWMSRGKIFEKLKGRDSWIHSLNNNLNLINQKFAPIKLNKNSLFNKSYSLKNKVSNFLLDSIYKKFIWIEHWHHPQPYLKHTLVEVHKEFKEDMMLCSSNRFRANNDLTQYLYRYWHLAKDEFYPYKYNDDYIANIASMDILTSMIKEIDDNKSINFVCFNDSPSLDDDEYEKISERLTNYLDSKFTNKASFEIK